MKQRHLVAAMLGCGLSQFAIADPFTADLLVQLDRVGSPHLSPDGALVAYTVRKTDMDANKGGYDIWLSGTAGGAARQLTNGAGNETSPAWSPDGETVYFLSSEGGSSQVWRIAVGGGEPQQVTQLPVDVATFRLSPSGQRLVFSADVYPDCEDLSCTARRDEQEADSQTTGTLYSQLFMRHWDYWMTEKRSQLFSIPLEGGLANRCRTDARQRVGCRRRSVSRLGRRRGVCDLK